MRFRAMRLTVAVEQNFTPTPCKLPGAGVVAHRLFWQRRSGGWVCATCHPPHPDTKVVTYTLSVDLESLESEMEIVLNEMINVTGRDDMIVEYLMAQWDRLNILYDASVHGEVQSEKRK